MKKTKKEVIAAAWRAIGFEVPEDVFPAYCANGWLLGIFDNGVDTILHEYPNISIDDIDYDIDMSGVGKFRPKALNGIESNNGWIKINSELASYKGSVWGMTVDGIKIVFDDASQIPDDLITHYQPYMEPEDLLFNEED
jgi:hypothetical protein